MSPLRLLVAVAVLGLMAGCVTRVAGTATAGFSAYTPPDDGSGYGQPIEAPMPLPATGLDGCAWTDDALPSLAPLNLKYANGTGSGCQFGAGNNSHEIIQVHLSGPYSAIQQATGMLEPVEIAGIPGRRYVFEPVRDKTFCSVELDIRAYSSFTVDAFDHQDFAPSAEDNSANCELAGKAADILVRRYVPLAGGTPFAGSRQRPADAVLRDLKPCEFVRNPFYTPVVKDDPASGTADFGTTCTYQDEHGALRELMSNGTRGLADLPRQLPDSQVTTLTFGDYPARQERNDEGCVLAIETGEGQVFAVDYTNKDPIDESCQIASAKLAASISYRIR